MEKGVQFNEERMNPRMKEACKQIQQKLETEKQVSAKKEEVNKKPELGTIRGSWEVKDAEPDISDITKQK